VLAKTIGKSDDIAHLGIFLSIFILYVALNLKTKAFNYDVLWVWHVATLVGVVWLEILNLADKLTN
jgi:hypothetical protein